ENLFSHADLGVQSLFSHHRLHVTQQLVAPAAEISNLFAVLAGRLKRLNGADQLLLEVRSALFDVPSPARLPHHGIDLDQIVIGNQVLANVQGVTKQTQAFKLHTSVHQPDIGIADNEEIGGQQGHEEKQADQAELESQTQPVHQGNGGGQQDIHKRAP